MTPFVASVHPVMVGAIGRAGVLSLLAVSLSGGCNTMSAPASRHDDMLQKSAIVKQFDVTKVEFPFVSLRNGAAATVAIDYHIEISATAPSHETRTIEDAVHFKSPQATWLFAYMQHSAWVYMNGGSVPRCVSAKMIRGGRSPAGDRWWFADAADLFYGERTLALRQHGRVIEMVPSYGIPETDWRPLTPQSYSLWWQRVNDALKLSTIFCP